MLLLASVAITLCSIAAVTADQRGCITSFDPNYNYFPSTFSDQPFAIPLGQTLVSTARDFTVQYFNSYKVVRNQRYSLTFVLYQCGADVPKYVPAADVKGDAVRYFEIPLQNVAIDSSVQAGFFQLLGLAPTLKQVSDLTVAPCIQKLLKQDKLQVYNSTTFTGPVIEAFQETDAPRNHISFDTTTDPGPLKRAEWIKYLALFFNAEEKAEAVYKKIEESYNCLNGSASKGTKPTVAWLSYFDGKWTLSGAPYKMQFVLDAGGKNVPVAEKLGSAISKDYNMSVAREVTALHAALEDVDVVIDETYLKGGPATYSMAIFTDNLKIVKGTKFKFVSSENVWSIYNRNSGSPQFAVDWFEGAIAQPQLVLADLISIIHPEVTTSTSINYFYNIAMAQSAVSLTVDDCTVDPLAAVEPSIPTCFVKDYFPPVPASTPPPPKSSARPFVSASLAVAAITLLMALV